LTDGKERDPRDKSSRRNADVRGPKRDEKERENKEEKIRGRRRGRTSEWQRQTH